MQFIKIPTERAATEFSETQKIATQNIQEGINDKANTKEGTGG